MKIFKQLVSFQAVVDEFVAVPSSGESRVMYEN